MLNQDALEFSSDKRRVSTDSDPFAKIIEKKERDTKRFLVFIEVMALVMIFEAVYVVVFRKV